MSVDNVSVAGTRQREGLKGVAISMEQEIQFIFRVPQLENMIQVSESKWRRRAGMII